MADAIRTHFRPYDLIVRYGGDEFVCALFDMEVEEATERFSRVSADLEKQQASVTVGLASLTAKDDLEDLLARADSAMYEERRRRREDRPAPRISALHSATAVGTAHGGQRMSRHARWPRQFISELLGGALVRASRSLRRIDRRRVAATPAL